MSKLETYVGNFIAFILILIVALSLLTTFFNLLFRDGRGTSLYGSRGEMYMSD